MFRDMNPNWTLCSLLALTATLETGCRPKGGVGGIEQGIPSIGAEHLSDQGDFALDNTRFIPQCFYYAMHRGRIHPGDILIVKDGATTGKVSYVGEDWPFSHAAVNEHVFILRPTSSALARYVFFFLYSTAGQHQIKKAFHGSAQGGINQSFIEQVAIPLPPLPVQERIVAILQKADEIRRKRQEALKIADQILPALFIEMFGDPATNPKGWPVEPMGDLVRFDTHHMTPQAGQVYPYLAPEHIDSHTGAFSGPHPTPAREIGSAKYAFTPKHVLYCKLRPYLNKVVLPTTSGMCSTELVPLRPGPNLLREFLAIYLRLPFFVSAATQKAQGTKMPRFGPALMKREPMMVPPVTLQEAFCGRAVQLDRCIAQARHSFELAETAFNVLLQRAFTGELTAEWEARNADWIAQQQALHERLPQLVLLAFLREKAARVTQAAAVLITALMKYAFLLQMEGAGRRRLYNFVPYHYGPFAQEVYSDLKRLQEQGLVAIEDNDEKTRISLADPDRAEQALQELPDDLQQEVSAIIEAYGNLDHEALLKLVYERYPGYAKKSRRRDIGKHSE